MNCQDISLILDDRDVARLSAVERDAMRLHLDACRDCAADWAAFARIAARTPPAPPQGLARVVAEALRVRAQPEERRRRSGRPLFLAGLLLAGAAAAVFGALYWPEFQTTDVAQEVTAPRPEGAAPSVSSSTASQSQPTTNPVTAAGGEPTVAPGPRGRMLVMPLRIEIDDARAVAFAEEVRRVLLGELRAQSALDVVELTPAQLVDLAPHAGPFGEDTLLFRAAARRFGGTSMVELSIAKAPNGLWSLVASTRYSTGTAIGSGQSRADLSGEEARPDSDSQSVGRFLTERITQSYPLTSAMVDDRARVETVLDRTRAENERVRALSGLNALHMDAEIIDAAVELGARAESAATRMRAWQILGQTYEPSLSRPLAYALLTDVSPDVRRGAARVLRDYLPFADARAVLEYAAASDVSTEVRLTARMMLLSTDEQRDFARATLLDATLTPVERLTLLSPAEWAAFSDRSARVAIAQIVAATDDPAVKRKALQALTYRRLPDLPPEVRDALMASAADTDDGLARLALNGLTTYVAEPSVRAVLEAALERDGIDAGLKSNIEAALTRAADVQ